MRRPNLSVRSTLFAICLSQRLGCWLLALGASLLPGSPFQPSFGQGGKFQLCEETRREARAKVGSTAPIISFPNTGGVDVSLHTLGSANFTEHRRRNHGYAVRLRKSETVATDYRCGEGRKAAGSAGKRTNSDKALSTRTPMRWRARAEAAHKLVALSLKPWHLRVWSFSSGNAKPLASQS